MINKKQRKRMKYISQFLLNPLQLLYKNKGFRRNTLYAYYLALLKIKENMVLFETSHGSKLAGNPYAIFKHMINKDEYKNYVFVLVVNNDNYYVNKYKHYSNVKVVKRDSDKYLKFIAQAKYLINDTTFHFYFQKKEGQVYINTWHGTPIKTLGNDVKGTMGQHKNAIRNFLHADYIINPNKFTADVIVNAHALNGIYNGHIVDEGYPRIDLTMNANKNEVKQELEEILDMKLNKKIILYAPTWRGEIGRVNNPEEEISQYIKEIYSRIPDDYIFLLKVHDLTYRYIKNNEELKEISIPDWVETNELLSIVDILITDYSSIFFDFVVTKRPILFFVYDKEKYETERGLYLDLHDMPGPLCENVDELIEAIETIDETSQKYKEKYEKVFNTYCYHDDGNATERFLDIVINGNHTDNVYKVDEINKKKVLIFGGGFTTNGVTTSLLNLLKNFDYEKYDVTIIYGGIINSVIQKNLEKLNPNIKVIYRMGTFNFKISEYYRHQYIINSGLIKPFIRKHIPISLYRKELKRIIGDSQFDIGIDFSGYAPFWVLLFAFNDFNKKAIYLHSDMVADSNRIIKGKKIFKKNFNVIFYLYKYFDKLVCVSKEATDINKKKLSDYGVSKKIVNVDNSIDYERILNYLNELEVENIFAKDYLLVKNTSNDGFISLNGIEVPERKNINFVTLGRLSFEKDHEKLIRAFSKVNRMFENTRLYIIGGGELKKRLNNLIDKLELNGKIFLVGEMINPFTLLNKCDCFVMSSNYEGQGIVVLEALILNKPVISTDIPGPRGILEEGYGMLVENSE